VFKQIPIVSLHVGNHDRSSEALRTPLGPVELPWSLVLHPAWLALSFVIVVGSIELLQPVNQKI
jgi:hypothetical protein